MTEKLEQNSIDNESDFHREQAKSGEIILTSEAGLLLLEKGVQDLDRKIRSEQLEMGWAANNDPDLRENPGFMETRVRLQNQYPAEKARLIKLKSHARISLENRADEICFGDTVSCTVDYGDDDVENLSFILLGPLEKEFGFVAPRGIEILSYLTPIAAGLWGKKIEQVNEVDVRINPKSNVKIRNIRKIK